MFQTLSTSTLSEFFVNTKGQVWVTPPSEYGFNEVHSQQ